MHLVSREVSDDVRRLRGGRGERGRRGAGGLVGQLAGVVVQAGVEAALLVGLAGAVVRAHLQGEGRLGY